VSGHRGRIGDVVMMMHELKVASVRGKHNVNVALCSPAAAIPVMLIAIPVVLCAILIANALTGAGRIIY
jgi:hypothetical protein